MTDKEVGDLWRTIVLGQRTSYSVHHSTKNVAEQLISKLVEERADFYRQCESKEEALPYYQVEINKALRDFGIEPEDWK